MINEIVNSMFAQYGGFSGSATAGVSINPPLGIDISMDPGESSVAFVGMHMSPAPEGTAFEDSNPQETGSWPKSRAKKDAGGILAWLGCLT